MDDVYEFRYNLNPKDTLDTKLHFQLVKQVQRCICYARYKEGLNDLESDDPTLWSNALNGAKTDTRLTSQHYLMPQQHQ
jgi:hypothetical protein